MRTAIAKCGLACLLLTGMFAVGSGQEKEPAPPQNITEPSPSPALPEGGDLAAYVLAPTVTVKTDHAQGTGVVFVYEKDGYVLTAAHVVRGNVEISSKQVQARDVFVVKRIIEEGEEVGKTELRAKIICYEPEDDVAVLKIVARNLLWTQGAKAAPPQHLTPKVGERIYHCGSLGGEQLAPESLTFGIISSVGRIVWGIGKGKVFDQTTATAIGGSSGGGVFYEDGTYFGMITLGAGETISLITPLRRMLKILHEWGLGKVIGYPQGDAEKPKTLQDLRGQREAREEEEYSGGLFHPIIAR